MAFFSGASSPSAHDQAAALIQRQLERLKGEELMDPDADPADSTRAIILLVSRLSPAAINEALDGVMQAVAILLTVLMQRTLPLPITTRSVFALALSRILREDHESGRQRSEEESALLRSASAVLVRFNETQRGHYRIITGG